MMRVVSSLILWMAVWMMLSWPVNWHDAIVGAVVSVFVTVMTLDIFKSMSAPAEKTAAGPGGIVGMSVRIAWFIVYIFVFLWECIKANIDVAYRVLSPDLPIRPGTFRVKTGLKSDIGLTFLTSSITLTPGMTSVDIDRDRGYVYIHFLYVTDVTGKKCPRLFAVARFEKILERIFE